MNTFDYINEIVFPAQFKLLPSKMDTLEARVLEFAIGLQESRFVYRQQLDGPAHGFWQFETAGVKGVLTHIATRGYINAVLRNLSYDTRIVTSYEAIVHNDILAGSYARLNLWWSSAPMPAITDVDGAWTYYVTCWNPGKPIRKTFDALHTQARLIVTGDNS